MTSPAPERVSIVRLPPERGGAALLALTCGCSCCCCCCLHSVLAAAAAAHAQRAQFGETDGQKASRAIATKRFWASYGGLMALSSAMGAVTSSVEGAIWGILIGVMLAPAYMLVAGLLAGGWVLASPPPNPRTAISTLTRTVGWALLASLAGLAAMLVLSVMGSALL